MFIVLFLLWIVMNGRVTAEILVMGLVLTAALYAFCCKYLGFSFRKDLKILRLSGLLIRYFLILLAEILKANFAVLEVLLAPHVEVEPVIVSFETDLKSEMLRVLLANSITLTPGTITVSLEQNAYQIHCLDKKFSRGLEDSIFVQELQKIEKIWYA